ncbi:hypothetical protein MNBD_GAMMA07-1556 [hydrothermal vent metagenome]|uniref:Alginate export domain-containing protein n=1 Tax=hydrothermal vent metagenome TaxID=652676 RepID=A0A3B0WQR9_9ZZZZ
MILLKAFYRVVARCLFFANNYNQQGWHCYKLVRYFLKRVPIFLGIFFITVKSVLAENVDISGQLAFELREFPESPAYERQFIGLQSSVFLESEFFWEGDSRKKQVKVVPFIRLDKKDDERTHFDFREAYWRSIDRDWDILIGINRIFWGVTESRHLVNIINQVDAVENIDEEDFLGQPMIQISRQFDIGRLDVFVMTGFRERTFPGRNGRLQSPLPVDTNKVIYESGAKQWRPEIALRYSHYIGEWDIGLHAFHGTGREPELLVSEDAQFLIPFYKPITQGGIDLQYTHDAWLLKLESIIRQGQGDTFAAAVAGVEYTLFQIFDSSTDVGFIVEGLYDDRNVNAFPTIFDRDVFIGSRLAFNDVQNTSLLIGFVADLNDGLETARIEVEHRLGDSYLIELEVQGFFQSNRTNPATVFENDSFIMLRLSRFY